MYMFVYAEAEQQYAQQYGEDWLNANIGGMTVKQLIKEETERKHFIY